MTATEPADPHLAVVAGARIQSLPYAVHFVMKVGFERER